MAILINPKRRRRKRTTRRRGRSRTTGKRAYAGDVARPKLVFSGVKGNKKIYKRTEKSKTKYPDVIVRNPRRKRKRNPYPINLTTTLVDGVYGAVGIAGVNAITNLASRFVNLDNMYLKNAIKLALGVGVPQMLRRQIGTRTAEIISSVVIAYVIYDLVKNLLPDEVKSLVSEIVPRYELPEPTVSELNALYPEDFTLTTEKYQI